MVKNITMKRKINCCANTCFKKINYLISLGLFSVEKLFCLNVTFCFHTYFMNSTLLLRYYFEYSVLSPELFIYKSSYYLRLITKLLFIKLDMFSLLKIQLYILNCILARLITRLYFQRWLKTLFSVK